jgi:predicted nucleic-acid-binding protein
MRAVDTNILVRLFVRDDLVQAAAARRAAASDTIFVPKTVIVEFEWVLRGVYNQTRTTIAASITALLDTADVEVEDSAAVARAVDWFRRGMDLADALHLASSGHAAAFLTFDVPMRRRASALAAQPPVVAP